MYFQKGKLTKFPDFKRQNKTNSKNQKNVKSYKSTKNFKLEEKKIGCYQIPLLTDYINITFNNSIFKTSINSPKSTNFKNINSPKNQSLKDLKINNKFYRNKIIKLKCYSNKFLQDKMKIKNLKKKNSFLVNNKNLGIENNEQINLKINDVYLLLDDCKNKLLEREINLCDKKDNKMKSNICQIQKPLNTARNNFTKIKNDYLSFSFYNQKKSKNGESKEKSFRNEKKKLNKSYTYKFKNQSIPIEKTNSITKINQSLTLEKHDSVKTLSNSVNKNKNNKNNKYYCKTSLNFNQIYGNKRINTNIVNNGTKLVNKKILFTRRLKIKGNLLSSQKTYDFYEQYIPKRKCNNNNDISEYI